MRKRIGHRRHFKDCCSIWSICEGQKGLCMGNSSANNSNAASGGVQSSVYIIHTYSMKAVRGKFRSDGMSKGVKLWINASPSSNYTESYSRWWGGRDWTDMTGELRKITPSVRLTRTTFLLFSKTFAKRRSLSQSLLNNFVLFVFDFVHFTCLTLRYKPTRILCD